MKLKSVEQQERHKRGVCVTCGDNNDRFPKWYCSGCLKNHNIWVVEYNKVRRASGICLRCGGNMEVGKYYCTPCTLKHNAETRERRRIKKEKGLI